MSDYASTSSRPASPVADLPAIPNTTRPYRFTWDSVNKRPGPGSVSESTEGRGGDYIGVTLGPYGEVHTPLTANVALAGAGPAVGLGADWTSSVHGFHGALQCTLPLYLPHAAARLRTAHARVQRSRPCSTTRTNAPRRPRPTLRCPPSRRQTFRGCAARTLTRTSSRSLPDGNASRSTRSRGGKACHG